MNSKIFNRGALCLAAAGALTFMLSSAKLERPAVIEVGDSVAYAWRKPLVNGMGRQSLADLGGAPILVEFWGTH